MYKFFVTDNQINNDVIEILDDDVNHIKNVLRLQLNEKIQICDITNSQNYICGIIEINNKYVKCKILEKIESTQEASLYLHIFQGLPKADKMETIIQKTTEIGVSEITPVIMNRSVVKLDEKTENKKIERWRKIAEVAAKQSKRDKIPQVNNTVNIKNIYKKIQNYDIVIVAYENEKNKTIKAVLKSIKNKNPKVAVIIGPEGGIDEKEIEILKEYSQIVTLGTRILRTETAPIVISSIIMYELGGMD